ncbi:MAG: cell wall-binding repeat-containing protein, partial [Acidimicrobiales bacterium]
IQVFRNGTAIADCAVANSTVANPDPCVEAHTTSGGVTTVTVLSSHASTWAFGVKTAATTPTATSTRLAGSNRIGTAIAVSKKAFPASGSAKAVVLARADEYPDALTGGPLAVAKGGPLLLTESSHLDAATLAEITRVLPKGGTVYVLGGDNALSASVVSSLTSNGFKAPRISGPNRFATAVAVAGAIGPKAVFEASGLNFPDALAAGPAAATSSGAILLTNGSTQSTDTSAYLKANGSLTRYAVGGPAARADTSATALVGGTNALSTSVATALTGKGFKTARLSGPTRFATAVAVAGAIGPSAIFEASGTNFPDALSAGPAAALDHGAILLTNGSTQSTETSTYLKTHGSLTRYAVGGPAARADSSATALVGANRFDTAAKVAGKFFTAPTTVGLATGLAFPDALAADPLLGTEGAPMLLVNPTGSLPAAVSTYLGAHKSTVTSVQVFGGTSAVSASVASAAVSAG